MNNQLDDFFNSKGIKKFVPEFSPTQEKQIQSVNEELIKPALKELSQKLSSYTNCIAHVSTSKKEITSIRENVELKFFRNTRLKFAYRIEFSVKDNEINAQGQYCIPNIYGETVDFKNTDLVKSMADLISSDISNDFSSVFIKHVDISK